MNIDRNYHQGTNIRKGVRTFSVILNRHLPATLRFRRFQVCLLHRDQNQRYHKCNRCGHFAIFLFCFNCHNLGHISKECPDSPRCCICKSLDHLAIDCEFSWCSSVINSASAPSCHNSSITKLNATATQMNVSDSLTGSMFLILSSSNHHNLHYQLKLQTPFRLLRLHFQLHLLLIRCLPTVTLYSLLRPPVLIESSTHLPPVRSQCRPQGSVEPDLLSGVTPRFYMESKHLSLVKARQNEIQPPLFWFSKPALSATSGL